MSAGWDWVEFWRLYRKCEDVGCISVREFDWVVMHCPPPAEMEVQVIRMMERMAERMGRP